MTQFRTAAAALTALALCAPMAAAPAIADEVQAGDILVRGRVIAVVPQDGSDLSLPGAETSIDTAIVPELDFTYFFTKNIAAELILATAPHEVSVQGAANLNLGDVWLLPPTLTLQYHFTELGAFKPYLGAGVNYTIFYNEDSGAAADIEYDNSFGLALQAGIDIEVADNVYFNLDVKKVFLNTDVTVTVVPGTVVTGDVDIDPWIIGAGVGYKF